VLKQDFEELQEEYRAKIILKETLEEVVAAGGRAILYTDEFNKREGDSDGR